MNAKEISSSYNVEEYTSYERIKIIYCDFKTQFDTSALMLYIFM